MKNRIVVSLSLIIAIVFCVPSVPVLAAEGDPDLKLYTLESVDGFFEGGFTGSNDIEYVWQDLADSIYNTSNDFFIENILSGLTNLPSDPNNNNTSPYTSGVFFITRDNSNNLTVYWPLEIYNNVSYDWQSANNVILRGYDNRIYFYSNCDAGSVPYYMMQSTLNSSTGIWSSPIGYTMQSFSYNLEVFRVSGALQTILVCLSDSIPVYDAVNYYRWHTVQGTSTPSLNEVYYDTGVEDYTNLHPADLPYFNGNEIITPDAGGSDEESNLNHLFLNNVDAGFCKPATQNDLSGAGGGYFYISYNFDSWINSHHGDYYLEFASLIGVDGTQYGRTQNIDLDLGGVNILPFTSLSDNDSWTNNALLFVEYPAELTSNFNYGYVYSMPYTKFIATDYEGVTNKDKLGKFRINEHTWSYGPARGTGNMINRLLLTPLGGRTFDISTMSFGEYLAGLFGNVNHNSFVIDVQFSLVDRVSGEKSGVYRKSFDLLNGVVNLQSNSIKDNNNPYIPQDDELSLVDYDSNGGYLPSFSTGDNNQIVNFSTPDNIKLFIDNGFSEFLHWYETSADTAYATNRFWSSMGIFEGNPATALYEEYFGFLPDDFKTLILSCAGIGIVGGAFCILRRRLH